MEAELLELAEDASAAQLERLLRGYRGAIAADSAEQTQSRRHLTTRWEDDGSLTIRASLPPDEAALFLTGVEAARDALRSEASRDDAGDDETRSREASSGVEGESVRRVEGPDRADALVALAETAVAEGVRAASGGDRNQIVVHVDAADLVSRAGTAAATLEEGVALPAEAARRLGCDAAIVSLVERDGEPVSVGRRTRSIPAAVARALRTRDRGCRFPGCGHERFVDAHHIEHWAHGGETSLDNLVLLCRRHHQLLHEGGFTVGHEEGELVFRDRWKTRVDHSPPLTKGSVRDCVRSSAIEADVATIGPNREGEPLDYELAVFALADRRERRVEMVG
jgi:hypothetical protein